MSTLTVRNVEEDVVAALKARAKRNKRSLEAEVRIVLRDAADQRARTPLRELVDRIAALTPKVPQTDSTELVRQDRSR